MVLITNFYFLENECYVFCQKVHYGDQEYNMASMVLFSTNQIADILCISYKVIENKVKIIL